MSRRLAIGVAAAFLVAGAGAAGIYVYFFSGLRTTPTALTLAPASTPSPGAAAPAISDLSGRWQVASGSVAGYRVREQFVGQSSPHEAVARTSTVSGSVTVTSAGSGYQADDLTFTADLSGLHSIDQVAGRDVSQRDSIVARDLDVSQFPTATFKASSALLSSDLLSGATDTITIPGQVTIHGVTKSVTATVQVRLNGATVEVAGNVAIQMTDFGVSPPQVGFVTVEPSVTIEFQLSLTKSS